MRSSAAMLSHAAVATGLAQRFEGLTDSKCQEACPASAISQEDSPKSGRLLGQTPHRSPARYLWAMLIARIYAAFPLTCPQCGTEMRIVAFITAASPVQQILNHIGEPSTPPRIAPARGPPQGEGEDSGAVFLDEDRFVGDPFAQPEPDFEFDQRISW